MIFKGKHAKEMIDEVENDQTPARPMNSLARSLKKKQREKIKRRFLQRQAKRAHKKAFAYMHGRPRIPCLAILL